MTDGIKTILLVGASLAAFALGGAAIADAASGGGGSNGNTTPSAAAPRAPGGLPPQRSDETALTGDTAAKVRAAALARVSGGTVDRVETDADGHAAYEAHMTKSDGSRVTVYVDKSFDVVSVEAGP